MKRPLLLSSGLETVKKLPVIANQSADWCGDPLVL